MENKDISTVIMMYEQKESLIDLYNSIKNKKTKELINNMINYNEKIIRKLESEKEN